MRAILMLHSVDPSGSAISLTEAELRGLLRAVRSAQHDIVPLATLLAEPTHNAGNAVALTFDDGMASLGEVAAPLLREEGATATLFLTTAFVGRDNHWPSQPASAPRLPMLDWGGVESLHDAGWQIESHTRTHPDLRTLSADELAEELESPQQEIERRLGRASRSFAYPYGFLDATVVDAVSARYDCAVTTRMAALASDPQAAIDPLMLPRLDTYYLRDERLQGSLASFGGFGGPAFRGWVALRGALRRWRGHPGEHA